MCRGGNKAVSCRRAYAAACACAGGGRLQLPHDRLWTVAEPSVGHSVIVEALIKSLGDWTALFPVDRSGRGCGGHAK
jgi:hypothetical protein